MLNLEHQLKKYYGYSEFRTGQKEIIVDLLAGNDVLGVLPTGLGKSICYQLPARILTGTVLVISPLISLMIDQVKQLKASGFKQVTSINSFLDITAKRSTIKQLEKYKLVYVSPEMLQNNELVQKLKTIKISLFVVDEAHCISQWGHEFRPDYLKLSSIIKELGTPPVLALSATATPEVQEDIINQLGTKRMMKHIHNMDRENIAFAIQEFDHFEEKTEYLTHLLKKFHVPTMIYFSSRMWTEKVADILSENLPELNIAYYHGGMEQSDRILIQQQFMNGQLDVICCTSAFGMGINKANIRLVIHFHLPTQLESFIQEVGRAGRDGKSSVSLVLWAPGDEILPKNLITSELPNNEVIQPIVNYFYDSDELIEDNKTIERFGISETQWRFLRYQLEKHGMIIKGRIIRNPVEINKVINYITDYISQREKYKEQKLSEIISWTKHTGCRRKRLFSPFQSTIGNAEYYCCDICDFDFSRWNPEFVSEKTNFNNWQEHLKHLLLQGETNKK